MMDNKNENDITEREIENAFRARGLKEAMQQWEVENRLKQRSNLKRLIRWSIAAAAVVLLTLMIYPQRNTIYRWAYKQYVQYVIKKRSTPAVSTERYYALTDKALNNINDNYSVSSMGANDQIIEAVTEIQNGDYTNAFFILGEIDSEDNPALEADVVLLKAICYNAIGEKKIARRLLKSLVDNNTKNAAIAKDILDSIK